MVESMFPGISIERDVSVPMRDGTQLLADVYRPVADQPCPVVLMRLPYGKEQAQINTYAHPSWYAQHGYIVVVQDTRGRWSSGGEFYPFKHEATDTFDTVEWAAGLSGTNRRVGMYGFSYAGATQLLGATLRPPHLTCICPALTGAQYYEGWAYNGGAFALAFNLSWATRLAMDTARRRGLDDLEQELWGVFLNTVDLSRSMPLNEFAPLLQHDIAPYYFDWLDHPTYDDYWKQWSIDERYDQISVPALHIAGWYDIFRDGTIKNFNGLRGNAANDVARAGQKLVVGPWYHAPWTERVAQVVYGEAARNPVDDLQLNWFDHWLKDVKNEDLNTPSVDVFVLGENKWRTYEQWPPSNAELTEIYLHSDGRANARTGDGTLDFDAPVQERYDVYVYDPQTPVPSVGGHSCCNPTVSPMGPKDQSQVEEMNGILVYTSAPLEASILVAGPVDVRLWFASSAVDTDFTAKLADVHPDGRAFNITEGIIRARYRDSVTTPSFLVPGEVYEVSIQLGEVCTRFAANHRLRLEISSSNFPHWDRNTNSGATMSHDSYADFTVATQLIFHDASRPSHIRMPIVSE